MWHNSIGYLVPKYEKMYPKQFTMFYLRLQTLENGEKLHQNEQKYTYLIFSACCCQIATRFHTTVRKK